MPLSSLYSSPAPIGLVTVITALPKPRLQLTLWDGIPGVDGCVLITAGSEGTDVHADRLTVNVYDPAGRPDIVVPAVDPVFVNPPGVLVTVHVPEVGSPLRTTLPVGTVQVGCVITPITGADGVNGCAIMSTSPD